MRLPEAGVAFAVGKRYGESFRVFGCRQREVEIGGRCIFSITHDTMEENGELWRYGIKSSRLTEKINEISANIREERDYGYQ